MDMFKKVMSGILALSLCVGVGSVNVNAASTYKKGDIQYDYNYTSVGELFISGSDIVEIVKEDRKYLSFANITGMGEILSLKERPDSDEKLAELMKDENRNIRFCYIENENCIVEYNYNTGVIIKTAYATDVKYTFDLVNKKITSKVTGKELYEFTDSWSYTVYYNGYISEMIYTGEGVFISPEAETKIPETNSSAFSCSSRDIVKVIRDSEEVFCFADQTGLGRILILSERPEKDAELISAIKEPKLNIHFCYLEDEGKMLHYDYNENTLTEMEDKMDVKYTIDLTQRNITDNSNNEIVLDLTESPSYWVINEDNQKKEMILVGVNFISPEGYKDIETNDFELGDINVDGTVDITDLSELSLALIGDKSLTEIQQKAADVNEDGTVTLADLARMKQYIVGIIDEF